jgi:predicted secreted protein
MTIAGGLAVYFVIWWTVLFAVLPFGVHSQAETGEVTDGHGTGRAGPARPAQEGADHLGHRRRSSLLVWYIWAVA